MPTINIHLTDDQLTRLSAAWQEEFGSQPTLDDVRAHLVWELQQIVFRGERKAAQRNLPAPAAFLVSDQAS